VENLVPLSQKHADEREKTGTKKPAQGGFLWGASEREITRWAICMVPETDRRLSAVGAQFTQGWILVEFLMYLIGYL